MSQDPNNTAWSRSTTNYGHKILSQQGWQPGSYLGATDAAHADHYTAANASHIRVMLREDNLGLGAKVGGNNAETFGLSLFSGVLGRLNGKTEAEVEKQQGALRDAELRRGYGMMGFVSGGFLVGDKIERRPTKSQLQLASEVATEEGPKTKKRKVEDDTVDQDAAQSSEKKSKKAKDSGEQSTSSGEDGIAKKPTRKEKRRKEDDNGETSTDDKANRAQEKQEKRVRKEERRRRKEERRARREAKALRKLKDSASQTPTTEANTSDSEASTKPQTTIVSTGNRQAVRQRYIQQKRMASMNPQAMKEIFMMKAAS